MGVIISNHELICISVVVGGNTSKCSPGRTPLGSPSPKQYKPGRVQGGISMPSGLLFRGSPHLSHQDAYVLQACSLLVIPPPAGSVAPQGGFLTDLTGINLSDWAALVQDMAAGLQALPPGLSSCLGLQVVNLLQLLEAATGVGFCHFCCNPEPHCRCVGVSQLTPPTSWSQIAGQTPGYGVTTSSGGVTTLSTSFGGISEYVAPPPGLSIWNMPPLEASLPKRPVVSPRYRPPIGRATQLRTALSRQAPALQAPQMAPPIGQPLPFPRGRPATPYQQAVQPLGKSSGLGVTFDSSANKAAPTGGQDTMYAGGRVL